MLCSPWRPLLLVVVAVAVCTGWQGLPARWYSATVLSPLTSSAQTIAVKRNMGHTGD